MITQYPILIVVIPLIGTMLSLCFTRKSATLSYYFSILWLGLSCYAAIKTLLHVIFIGPISYHLAGWAAPIGIEYAVDQLNGIVLVMVSLVAVLTAVFSRQVVLKEIEKSKIPVYYTLFTLLVTGLLGITITGDAFNLYVLLEIAALTSYALIALGRGRAYLSTFNYIIIGSIGACFYLLGVGYLLLGFGTLNMAEIFSMVMTLPMSQTIFVAFVFIILGLWIKMAFFGVHGWLPNAYTYAPTATSCLVAPLMTKVTVYVMIRFMYNVFSADMMFETLSWQPVILVLAVIAILGGSLFALAQTNLKKMLTYLIVAEIGYMVGGAWLGNIIGLRGAIYHILADGLMTSCLFMAAGCFIYKLGRVELDDLSGCFKKMPLTMIAFLVGAFSMIGIPPTCGFFSKWYLLSGAIQAGAWHFLVALLASSLINAILFFRIIEKAFFGKLNDQTDSHNHSHDTSHDEPMNEAPASMLIPLWVTAGLVICMGLYTKEITLYIINAITAKSLL